MIQISSQTICLICQQEFSILGKSEDTNKRNKETKSKHQGQIAYFSSINQ